MRLGQAGGERCVGGTARKPQQFYGSLQVALIQGDITMPWRKKTKTADDWKPVRVRKAWLDLMRLAGKENPRFGPTIDLTTASEPKTLEFACQIASWFIRGIFWDEMRPKLDQIIRTEQVMTAHLVAVHFGAEVRSEEDGSLWIIEEGKPDSRLPIYKAPRFPRSAMF